MEIDRLAYMANQIARNLAAQGVEVAVEETAHHLRNYWDPRMLTQIRACDPALLDPIARAAVARLQITTT